MSEILREYQKILDLAEDYIRSGYRRLDRTPASKESFKSGKNSRESRLLELRREIDSCKRCALWEGRTNVVTGEGVLDPLVMVIGEGPGEYEDKTARPFVGKAGQYLDKWLKAIGLSREKNCFIGNIVKCRPPGNRDPLPGECESCLPFLLRQIELIKPKVILTAGRISSRILTGEELGMGKLRGKVYNFRGIPLIPTYHPSAVLRNSELRRPVWDDLKRLKSLLENHVS
ncbi:MAG: uracil-DNA glycosylase [Spirochaetes bacterium]|nr:MAG: uracil-DNA glycosylase [Spirochaetota bacterium]